MILQDWDSTQPGQDGGQVSFFFCPLDEVFAMIDKYKDEVFTKYKTLFQISADGCACEKVLAKQWNLTQLSPRDPNRSWIWKKYFKTCFGNDLCPFSCIAIQHHTAWFPPHCLPRASGFGNLAINKHCGQKGCNAGWREHWILNHDPAIMKRYKSQKEDK